MPEAAALYGSAVTRGPASTIPRQGVFTKKYEKEPEYKMTNTWLMRIQQAHVRVFGRAPQGGEWHTPSKTPDGPRYRVALRAAVDAQLKARWGEYLDNHKDTAGHLKGVPIFKPGFLRHKQYTGKYQRGFADLIHVLTNGH